MDSAIEITHKEQSDTGTFYIDIEGKHPGAITYNYDDDGDIVIEHTVVKEEFEGRGLGKKLIDAVVNFARSSHRKITPLCPYAHALMHKHEQYHDILKSRE